MPERPPRRSGTQSRVRAKDVLVVEDDRDTREVLAVILGGAGFDVRACATVEEALALVRERIPDIVVTDLQLPRSSGRELAEALRADPSTSHVALVAATGAVDPHWDVVRWFDAYLRKPLDLDVLPQLLDTLAAAAEAAARRVGP
jgi:CheY-like chemotaxis protein